MTAGSIIRSGQAWFRKVYHREPLQVMQAGTIIWLFVLGVFVTFTRQCPWEWEVPFYRVDLRYFSCRTTNELGDFLAGAFAPLAFLWLAGAVFIQARELKEQREVLLLQKEELSLTRDEMEASRDVMKQQAKEAKATTQFIGQQTELLKHEAELRVSQDADKQLAELIEVISSTLDRISIFNCVFRVWGENETKISFRVTHASWSNVQKITSISQAYTHAMGLTDDGNFLDVGKIDLSKNVTDEIFMIDNVLNICERLLEEVSASGAAKFELYKLDDAQRAVKFMITAANSPDPKPPVLG